MKGSGSCNSRISINIESVESNISLKENKTIQLTLKPYKELDKSKLSQDKRLIFSKDSKINKWTIKVAIKSPTYKEDLQVLEEAKIIPKHGMITEFTNYNDLHKAITKAFKNKKLTPPQKRVKFSQYFIKGYSGFSIYKQSEKWHISYWGEDYLDIYKKEVESIVFDKRSESVEFLEKWFAHHNISAESK